MILSLVLLFGSCTNKAAKNSESTNSISYTEHAEGKLSEVNEGEIKEFLLKFTAKLSENLGITGEQFFDNIEKFRNAKTPREKYVAAVGLKLHTALADVLGESVTKDTFRQLEMILRDASEYESKITELSQEFYNGLNVEDLQFITQDNLKSSIPKRGFWVGFGQRKCDRTLLTERLQSLPEPNFFRIYGSYPHLIMVMDSREVALEFPRFSGHEMCGIMWSHERC